MHTLLSVIRQTVAQSVEIAQYLCSTQGLVVVSSTVAITDVAARPRVSPCESPGHVIWRREARRHDISLELGSIKMRRHQRTWNWHAPQRPASDLDTIPE